MAETDKTTNTVTAELTRLKKEDATVSIPEIDTTVMNFSQTNVEDIDASLFSEQQTTYPAYWMANLKCKVCEHELADREFFCAKHPPVVLANGKRETNLIGTRFFGTVISSDVQTTDEIDPTTGDFKRVKRWVIQAAARHVCYKGPTDQQVEVQIEAGDDFSVMAYSLLPLETLLGSRIFVEVSGRRKHPTKPDRTLIDFSLRVDKRVKQMRNEERLMLAKAESARLLSSRVATINGGRLPLAQGLAPLAPAPENGVTAAHLARAAEQLSDSTPDAF